MIKSEFLKWACGKKIGANGDTVDLIKAYLEMCYEIKDSDFVTEYSSEELWENFENISQLKGKFSKLKNTPSFVPAKGDIAFWGASVCESGHAAIAVGKSKGTSKFVSLDQHWNGIGKCAEINHNYKGMLGVFRPLLKTATINMNIRSGPGIMTPITGELKRGELLRPLEYKNGFARIGENKWVSAEHLD